MNGGAISGNTGYSGGGVSVYYGGDFTMNGSAKVSGNKTTALDGGGVYSYEGTITMSGSAEVSGNTAAANGGGFSLGGGTLTIEGNAKIINNEAAGERSYGGGISTGNHTTITMKDNAEVSGNTAKVMFGGGIEVCVSTFTMEGGTISGNQATGGKGGGVSVDGYSTFTMTGGTIHGSSEGDGKANTATGGGAAVYKKADGIVILGADQGAPERTWETTITQP
jgi:hypothetical protein